MSSRRAWFIPAASLTFLACATTGTQPPPRPVPEETPVAAATTPAPVAAPPDSGAIAGPTETSPAPCALEPVFFGFNQKVLDPRAEAVLVRNAACIRERGIRKLVIEGHCDERGTVDYNLQLGQRRAEATKRYLVVLLPDRASDIQVVSYGKEALVCLEQTEECWARCRRAELVTDPPPRPAPTAGAASR